MSVRNVLTLTAAALVRVTGRTRRRCGSSTMQPSTSPEMVLRRVMDSRKVGRTDGSLCQQLRHELLVFAAHAIVIVAAASGAQIVADHGHRDGRRAGDTRHPNMM